MSEDEAGGVLSPVFDIVSGSRNLARMVPCAAVPPSSINLPVRRHIGGQVAEPNSFRFMSTTDVTVLVDSASSGGKMTVFTETAPPGYGPPPHAHEAEVEHLVPIDGTLEAFDGISWAPMPKAGFFVSTGQVHTWRNVGDGPATVLCIFSPGGFDRLMREIAGLSFSEADLAHVRAAAARAGVTIHPPA